MPFKPFETKMTEQQVIDGLKSTFGNEFTTPDVRAFCAMNDISYNTVTRKIKKFRVKPGKWSLKVTSKRVRQIEKSYSAPAVEPKPQQNLVPEVDDTFVKFGSFNDLKKIVSSKLFYPTFITGLSGNGKTFGVEQVCAQLGRELIRVNITIETDEDDLIGGFRLVNGETVWHNGPVIEALERGAILLLDEIDLASNKILCLQSVLEGNGVFLKKIGRFVKPRAGFNVFATANTKGKGSDDGRFIGTNVLNEAFLERFPVTYEQDYPAPSIEKKILGRIASTLGVTDTDFLNRLVDWADIIRKTFYDGGIEDIISTRRLVHIVRAYSIFNDKAKAMKVCINRFDDETKQSFLELYDKVDADFNMNAKEDKMHDESMD
ncbi:MAG: cobaltochelatase subunit CobS [uncultured marine virus]|nr:MAG: cobaltochelatase subunit CobS [uncultured marine virus]